MNTDLFIWKVLRAADISASVSLVCDESWARYEKSRIPLTVQSNLLDEWLSGSGKPMIRPRSILQISVCSFPDICEKLEIPFKKFQTL